MSDNRKDKTALFDISRILKSKQKKKQKQTQRQRTHWLLPEERMEGRRVKKIKGIERYKLPFII